jgi:glutathione S-transferase
MDFIVQHIRVNVGRVQFNRVLAPMFGRESDQSSIDLGLEFLAQNLPQVEAQLSATNYLCGDDMTLADIVLLASLEPSEMAGLDLSPYPALQAWLTSAREETFYTNVHSHFGAELGR